MQLFQDAMAIVRALGKPDLFVTMTCNPKWPEITKHLLPGQDAKDRPDLVARVFNLKVRVLCAPAVHAAQCALLQHLRLALLRDPLLLPCSCSSST